eukprot:CAMPEP_0197941344 /NCGR_PEP_ID=MMETSP1439-20131203/122626_1 /TAXON_ID=66791 /ORGANISM="Gonyaulax spinifera, Strain CCMP409" /LENGTH=262 /DNA_ID=CAMNT_0043564537 /DNA_START=30 /DNA_END=819 /DNA_ORIENTATION=+
MGGHRKRGGAHEGRGKEKKQRVDDTQEGERGFLITGLSCQDALRGVKDLRLWLDVEAPAIAGSEAPAGVPTAPCTAAAALDAELAELREGDTASRRFLPQGMVCKEVAFLRAQSSVDVPSELALRFLGPSSARRFSSRFADRVLPVDGSSRPKRDAFEALAKDVLGPHSGKPWRLVFEPFRGGWNTITREDAMATCKGLLGEDQLSVSSPEVTILCTLCPRFVGLAALRMDPEDLQVMMRVEHVAGWAAAQVGPSSTADALL